MAYDGRKKNLFGFASDNVQITTDDAGYEVKSFSVYASLEEYYSSPVGGRCHPGPCAVPEAGEYRSGKLSAGQGR